MRFSLAACAHATHDVCVNFLVQIPSMTGQLARALAAHAYMSLDALAGADINKVSDIIRTAGPFEKLSQQVFSSLLRRSREALV